MSRNYFTVKDVIEEYSNGEDDKLKTREIWEKAKENKSNIKMSTVKDMCKKLADGSPPIYRERVDGRGNPYAYWSE